MCGESYIRGLYVGTSGCERRSCGLTRLCRCVKVSFVDEPHTQTGENFTFFFGNLQCALHNEHVLNLSEIGLKSNLKKKCKSLLRECGREGLPVEFP